MNNAKLVSNIDRLTDANWYTWSVLMESLLRINGVRDCINDDFLVNDPAHDNDVALEMQRKDDLARSIIPLYISPAFLPAFPL